jgi:purine nucleoside phosphorylase
VEATPRDGDVVGESLVVEIAVATVLEIAVVNPCLCNAVEAEVIPSVAVVSARTYEGEVAQDDVAGTFLEIENT